MPKPIHLTETQTRKTITQMKAAIKRVDDWHKERQMTDSMEKYYLPLVKEWEAIVKILEDSLKE